MSTRLLILVCLCISLLAGCASTRMPPIERTQGQVPHPWSSTRGHTANAAGADLSGLAPDSIDRVFLNCNVAQGNGFNWAATIGWLSGEVSHVAELAAAYEAAQPGRRAGIDLRCLTGSSSGSAVAALMDHLLANEQLVGPGVARGERLLSVQQARDVSAALFFLALSTDFGSENIALGLTAIGAYMGLLDRASRGEPVSLWRSKSTAQRNLRIFGKWIHAASRYDPAWFEELTAGEPFAIPTFEQRSLALGHTDDHPAAQRMRALSRKAGDIVDQRINSSDFDLKPLGEGFCVTALTIPVVARETVVDLDELLLVYVCNPATSEALAPYLATMLGDGRMARQLRLATARDWETTLNLSTREADLVTPLSGKLLEPPIDLDTLSALDGDRFSPADDSPRIVLGGFAGPRLQAWAATALMRQRVAAWRTRGVEVQAHVSLFGRPEVREDATATFAQRTVTRYFSDASPDDEAPSSVLLQFYDWQDEYCNVVDRLEADPALQAAFFRMDWNLGSSPAAMTGRSRELAALGYNLSKVQRAPENAPASLADWFRAYVFSAEDNESFLPSRPSGGEPSCRVTEELRALLQERDAHIVKAQANRIRLHP